MSYPSAAASDLFLTINLHNQTITNDLVTTKDLKTRADGWVLYFTQYVQSEMAGWISLNLYTQ